MSISTFSCDLSIKNENNLMTGDAFGRPPTNPVNAGAIPVEAWAISEAKNIHASLNKCFTAIFTTTSRLF